MEKEKILQNFGLTESEVKLYIKLLQTGESTANDLSKKTNTNRTFTYDRLKKLIELGLISYIVKDNKKYFRSTKPKNLLEILKEREEQIKSILPELEKLENPVKETSKIEIFSSKKGIKTALNIILKEKKEILIHGSLIKFKDIMKEYYDIWNGRRIKDKIKTRILTTEDVDLPFVELDLLTEEESSDITTFTSGNKTLILLWSEIPIAIFIESEDISRSNNSFFNNIWNREIKIYSGVEGIKRAWFELISKKSKELVGYGFSWRLAQIYGRELSNTWHKQRLKNKISTRLISYDDPNSKKYFDVRMIEWEKFNLRFLDKDICGPACVTLSDSMVVEFLYTEKKFRVIVSRNKEMIEVYRKYFETLWKKSKKN